MITKIKKTLFYSRLRQYLPMNEDVITDDRELLKSADIVTIQWPPNVKKPLVGLIQDYWPYPSWTKYERFLSNNSFPFRFFNIHAHDWIEKAEDFDVIIGIPTPAPFSLEELRTKFSFLENRLKKVCYPSANDLFLYEDKRLESYLSRFFGIDFVKTYVSHDKEDALHLVENFTYPIISKVVPSSASIGVELIQSKRQAKKIIRKAFSNNGRKTHVVYYRQKNYVYFQDYIKSDGYDIRIAVVGDRVFGFYRLIPSGDFRASGMHHEEMKDLPAEAMKIARKVYKLFNSPQLIIDLLHGADGKFYINEISPLCQMSTQAQLKVDGVPGAYVFDADEDYHFEPGSYWVHELAIKEFFQNHYLPKVKPNPVN